MPKGSGYGPNYRAAMAGAELQWKARSHSQRRALLVSEGYRGTPARCIPADVPHPTYQALADAGCAVQDAPRHQRWLTPMGLLVREAGLALEARRPSECSHNPAPYDARPVALPQPCPCAKRGGARRG